MYYNRCFLIFINCVCNIDRFVLVNQRKYNVGIMIKSCEFVTAIRNGNFQKWYS